MLSTAPATQSFEPLYNYALNLHTEWAERESVDYDQAESLISACREIPFNFLIHLPTIREAIVYADENQDWDSNFIGNLPEAIARELEESDPQYSYRTDGEQWEVFSLRLSGDEEVHATCNTETTAITVLNGLLPQRGTSTALPELELAGTYRTQWAEGDVFSRCSINTRTLSISAVDTSDEGDSYEQLIAESVQVYIDGSYHTLEAAQGDLTQHGKQTLQNALLPNHDATQASEELKIAICIDSMGRVESVITDKAIRLDATVLDHNCDSIDEQIVIDWNGNTVWSYGLVGHCEPTHVAWAEYLCGENIEPNSRRDDDELRAIYDSANHVLTVSDIDTETEELKIKFSHDDDAIGELMAATINRYLCD